MFDNLFAERGLSFERLRAFIEVAVAQGISKAHPNDPVRQSQYSRQIKELEEFFGVPLAHRKGKRLELNADGKELMRLVLAHFTSLSDFKHHCASRQPTLRIGAGDSILNSMVIPRAARIQKALGGMPLELVNLRASQILEQLDDQLLDFGIVREDSIPSRLCKKKLGCVNYSLFVPTVFCANGQDKKINHLLQNIPLATHNRSGTFWQDLEARMKKQKIQINVSLTCESFPQAAAAVSSGHYAAILPDFMQDEFDAASIQRIELPGVNNSKRNLALCWHPGTEKLRPKVARASDILISMLRLSNDRS